MGRLTHLIFLNIINIWDGNNAIIFMNIYWLLSDTFENIMYIVMKIILYFYIHEIVQCSGLCKIMKNLKI